MNEDLYFSDDLCRGRSDLPMYLDCRGLDKAEVLMALYNASHAQGMGILHHVPCDMTIEQARKVMLTTTRIMGKPGDFDYLAGRVMKINLSKDLEAERLFVGLYDRDCGDGAAERAIAHLRKP